MKGHRLLQQSPVKKQRERCRTIKRNTRSSPTSSSSSWPSLLWMFAAAAIATSPPSSSTSAPSWAVRGEESTTTIATTDKTNVRGGRGEGRGGSAFVRRQQQDDIDEDDDEDEHHDAHDFEHDNGHDDGEGDGVNRHNNNNKQDNSNIKKANPDEEQALAKIHSTRQRREKNQRNDYNYHPHQQQHDDFLEWCQDSLGINVGLVEIDHFGYPDYIRAMEDRIDVFCDDCNEEDDNDEDNYNDIESDNNNKNDSENDATDREKENGNDSDSLSTKSKQHKIESLDDGDRYLSVEHEYPPVSVRGLKASRDIQVGEVVLSIPHSALWTVHNAIDASGDIHLVAAIGPAARQTHGWECPGMDEIPLLAITLLYHMDKNRDRPDHGPYLEILELQTNKLEEMIPHLWSSRKLRKVATPSVRNVAKGIRQDVVDLYESIVMVLIEDHPTVFGNQKNEKKNNEWMFSLEKFHWAFALVNSRHWHLEIPDDPTAPFSENDGDENDENNLVAAESEPIPPVLSPVDLSLDDVAASDRYDTPVDDTDDAAADAKTVRGSQQLQPGSPPDTLGLDDTSASDSNNPADDSNANTVRGPVVDDDEHASFAPDQEGPPAATPTDEWVDIQDQKLREEEDREMKPNETRSEDETTAEEINNPSGNNTPFDYTDETTNDDNEEEEDNYWPSGNSFLAPLADLLNFGPPCTRGIYNHGSNAFEIIATCDFRKGQEITFWYTDACEDVFVANYGFTMPMMVPKCQGGDGNNDDGSGRDGGSVPNAAAGSVVWQQQEQQQQYLEDELFHAYQELDRLDQRLDFLMGVLDDCHCGNQTELLAGAWSYDDDDEENNNNNDMGLEDESKPAAAQENIDAASVRLPLPRSPTPPKRTTITKSVKGEQPDAQHAIRDRRNRNSGGSSKRNSNSNSNSNGGASAGSRGEKKPRPPQQQRRRQRMTRFRSRSHQDRRSEF